MIEKEVYSVEHGKPYVIMVTRYTGEKIEYSEEDTYIGFEKETNEDRKQYNEKLVRSLKKKLLGVSEKEKEILETVCERLSRI